MLDYLPTTTAPYLPSLIQEETKKNDTPEYDANRQLPRQPKNMSTTLRIAHVNFIPIVGVGKETRTLIGPWLNLQNGRTRYWNYLEGRALCRRTLGNECHWYATA